MNVNVCHEHCLPLKGWKLLILSSSRHLATGRGCPNQGTLDFSFHWDLCRGSQNL